MNTLRKIRKNAKALSPVVASIILIAVTVAVSIAVAVWMGSLSTGFMQTEQVSLGQLNLDSTADTVSVLIKNTGTASVTISEVYFAGSLISTVTAPTSGIPFSIVSNGNQTLTFAATIDPGSNYLLKVVTSKATPFTTTGIAP